MSARRVVSKGEVRAIGYVRVSQEREGMTSPESQQAAIEEHCRRCGYELVEVIHDIDESGRFWKRRKIERAVTLVEMGSVEVIVVSRWSRVARNRFDWAVAVDRVESVGGRLESALEPMDPGPSGRFARGMLAEIAAYESERQGEYWREAQARRLDRGLPSSGAPHFGYMKVDGQFLPDPQTGPLLREAYRRVTAGDTLVSVIVWLQNQDAVSARGRVFSTYRLTTLTRLLDHGFGAGLLYTKDGFRPGAQTPVITARQWAAYRACRARRLAPKRGPDHREFLLCDLAWCQCGRAMNCSNHAGTARYMCSSSQFDGECPGCSIIRTKAENAVREWLALTAHDAKFGAASRHRADQYAARRQIDARTLAVEIAHPSEIAGRDPFWVRTKLAALTLAETESCYIDPVSRARDLLEDWDNLTVPMRQRQLRALVSHVVIGNRAGDRKKGGGGPRTVDVYPACIDPGMMTRLTAPRFRRIREHNGL